MLNRIFNRRRSGMQSDFEFYLRNVERRQVSGLPSFQEAKRDYQAALRSRNPFIA